jgi:hypothetical protein
VLVVKTEQRGSIPGIVHGASTSGASLFLEPLSTVEINNDIVALEEQEAEEVRRILLALTDAFRARAADMHRTIEAATDLDILQGRARFSESIDGIEPALSSRRRVRAAGGAASARQERRAGDDQGDSAGDGSAGHRTEHRREDGGAEDRGPAGDDGAVGASYPRRGRFAPAGVPIGVRGHRRRAVDRSEPEHVFGAHRQHRHHGPGAGGARAGAARRSRLGHRSD